MGLRGSREKSVNRGGLREGSLITSSLNAETQAPGALCSEAALCNGSSVRAPLQW